MNINVEVSADSVLVIRNGHDPKLFFASDLMYTNELHIGHIFNSVLHTKKKTKQDYGNKWINYRLPCGTINPLYIKMKIELEEMPNDFDRYNYVLSYLGEELLEHVED